MSNSRERKFLASKPSLPSANYNLEDAWKQYGKDFESPEKFVEHVATEIKKCNDNILHFAENYFYVISVDRGREVIQLYDCQKTIIQNLVDNRFNAIVASRQIGKALDIDTDIPTPNGFIKMGDLKDGDYVFGSDGNPTKVIKAWDVMYNRTCYEVIFDNGEKIIADEDHNWFTQIINEKEGKTRTTNEILKSLYFENKPNHKILLSHSKEYRSLSNNNDNFRTIIEINKVESRPVRCITVEAEDHLFLCGKSYIPTSNTTLVTIYALWQACFNKDQNIFVLANKEDTAKMILERIRLAYEEIPNWLKPTVVEFSKTSIKFDNGSKISTSTTSSQGIRGQAANCVDGSSIVTIRDKNTGRVFDISMEELYSILEKDGDILPIFIEK